MQCAATQLSNWHKQAAPRRRRTRSTRFRSAFRKRTLFKMDFAELGYIAELRTGPAGHFSYRKVAYAMYEAVAKRHPALAKYLRVHDVREPVDLLKR